MPRTATYSSYKWNINTVEVKATINQIETADILKKVLKKILYESLPVKTLRVFAATNANDLKTMWEYAKKKYVQPVFPKEHVKDLEEEILTLKKTRLSTMPLTKQSVDKGASPVMFILLASSLRQIKTNMWGDLCRGSLILELEYENIISALDKLLNEYTSKYEGEIEEFHGTRIITRERKRIKQRISFTPNWERVINGILQNFKYAMANSLGTSLGFDQCLAADMDWNLKRYLKGKVFTGKESYLKHMFSECFLLYLKFYLEYSLLKKHAGLKKLLKIVEPKLVLLTPEIKAEIRDIVETVSFVPGQPDDAENILRECLEKSIKIIQENAVKRT